MTARRQSLLLGVPVRALLLFAILSWTPALALGRPCGDDVGGRRVACACGDTVVVDTRLLAGDPVVRGRCRGDGLLVQADPMAETITLDLGGLSIVGSGVGDGIAAVAGGSDGAVLVGGTNERRGEIVGFGVGVNVREPTSVRRIEALDLKGQRHEGLMLRSAGAVVRDVRASRNGGDGIRVSGQGGRLVGIEATENAGAGVRLTSRYTILEATAVANRTHGIVVRGSRSQLDGSVANRNEGYGIVLGGYENSTRGIVAEGNSAGSIAPAGRREASK